MTCKCGDCFILACFSRLSRVNWNCLCYTVLGLVLARPSQIKLIWFSDAALLFVVEWRQNTLWLAPRETVNFVSPRPHWGSRGKKTHCFPRSHISFMLSFFALNTLKGTTKPHADDLTPRQTIATCQRNISQHCWAQHVACVWPPCCDVLQHVGCC